MTRIEKGFFNRMKKLTPIRMLGTGMDLGDLNEYSHEICFLLIQNIFKRELREDVNRTRKDMIFITEGILRDMNLHGDREMVERIVDGTLWYRDPTRQESFSSPIFNEDSRMKEYYLFRYFTIDRESSLWDQGGSTVFMLTEESQEMIFITREILEEFGFDLEQFYTLQLIKRGNFSKAKDSIDNLIARVRVLINREREYRRDIIREPQNIFIDRRTNGRKTEEEIKEQFDEEKEVFQKMLIWKDKYEALPEEKREEAESMYENLERARALHDSLAKYVVENLALEMEIKVKYPESFWRISNFSFKNDIWKNNIIKNGLNKVDDLEEIILAMFSPRIEFIYPLDWAWGEQMVKSRRRPPREIISIEEEKWKFREVDWDLIVELWEDIFLSLLDKGYFSILQLNKIDGETRRKWLSQRENIDLFMMFVISELTLDYKYVGEDERLKLFKLLCKKNERFTSLQGKRIKAKLEDTDERFNWKELFISPYTIYIGK